MMKWSVRITLLVLAASYMQAEPIADPGSRGVNWEQVKAQRRVISSSNTLGVRSRWRYNT
ncbi:MAG: hypothetical protein IH624_13585 [Phycisphaerae bacterium]|nr:hypothetical protein [Phycisphaerae bacterium]